MSLGKKIGLGQRIKFFRGEAKLTQKELANLASISNIALIRYESGERMPPVDVVSRIAGALRVTSDELLLPDSIKIRIPADISDKGMAELQTKLDARSDKISEFVKILDKMNEVGQEKLMESVREVAKIPEYKRKRKTKAQKHKEEVK